MDSSRGNELWEYFMEKGKEFNIKPATPNQISRIECGMLSYGSDMSLNETPYDINMSKFVNLDKKANFLSKDALTLIKNKGITRELVGIEIVEKTSDDFIGDHLPIFYNNQIVGKITSSVYSPRLKKNIGLAILETKYKETKNLILEYNNKAIAIKISKLPFLRNK